MKKLRPGLEPGISSLLVMRFTAKPPELVEAEEPFTPEGDYARYRILILDAWAPAPSNRGQR
jgi:hypothetical protein